MIPQKLKASSLNLSSREIHKKVPISLLPFLTFKEFVMLWLLWIFEGQTFLKKLYET